MIDKSNSDIIEEINIKPKHMSNKMLAMFLLGPIWSMFFIGFLEGFTGVILVESDGVYMIFGLWLMVFCTWTGVRLYRTK